MRISTTTIESFRLLKFEDWQTEEKFIAQVKGETPPSKNMELGTAFHDIIQNPHERLQDGVFVAKNGVVFPMDVIMKCFEHINYDYPFEIKLTKKYDVLGESITVVSQVDQLIADHVMELKSCWSAFDYDKYSNSMQWRFYLDIFESSMVRYNVFEMYDGANGIVLKGIHPFYFNYNDSIPGTINDILEEFVAYIHSKNLEPYFPEKN